MTQNKHYVAFAGLHNCKEITFVVVGAGGTGGYLVSSLGRVMALVPNLYGKTLSMLLIDGDSVEDKNLVRQNFTEAELGQNKAEALATRISKHGVKVYSAGFYLESPEQLCSLLNTLTIRDARRRLRPADLGIVLVGAVDNDATRILMGEALGQCGYQYLWIDSGNTYKHGQVVVGGDVLLTPIEGVEDDDARLSAYSVDQQQEATPTAGERIRRSPHAWTFISKLPTVIERYPDILLRRSRLPTEMACADHAVSAPQDILVNQWAANTIMAIIRRLIFQDSYIPFGEVQFNIDDVASTPIQLTSKYILEGLVKAASLLKYRNKELDYVSVDLAHLSQPLLRNGLSPADDRLLLSINSKLYGVTNPIAAARIIGEVACLKEQYRDRLILTKRT